MVLLLQVLFLLTGRVEAFLTSRFKEGPTGYHPCIYHPLGLANNNLAAASSPSSLSSSSLAAKQPAAKIRGYVSPSDLPDILAALTRAGFDTDVISYSQDDDNSSAPSQSVYEYSFVRATGMLKLMESSSCSESNDLPQPPAWIPIVSTMEHVLVENGWSFLDPDESEPLSAYDVDAANKEGLYQPKWGQEDQDHVPSKSSTRAETIGSAPRSSLDYDLTRWTTEQIVREANHLASNKPTRSVLLEGATDPPHAKQTHNGYDFSGSIRDLKRNGFFVCAIGGLPLFAEKDLSPLTASSGWLTFTQPISEEHVTLVQPLPEAMDQRVEVLCARTQCHVGHYFGPTDGYCINASVLDYLPRLPRETASKYGPCEMILLVLDASGMLSMPYVNCKACSQHKWGMQVVK